MSWNPFSWKSAKKAAASVAKSVGGGLGAIIVALRGNQPGGWASDHREEVNHNTGWNYIAVHAIASQVMQADVECYADGDQQQQQKRRARRKCLRDSFGSVRRWKALYGQDDTETDPLPQDHPLVRLMKRPNKGESGGMFNYRRAQQLRLTGTCLVWNLPSQATGANGRRIIFERYVIPTAAATPIQPSSDMPYGGYRIDGGLSRWAAQTDDGFVEFPGSSLMVGRTIDARQVQIVRLPHPLWLDDGQSPTSAGSLWIDTAGEVDQARFSHLRRGATPSLWVDLGEDSDLDQDGMDRAAEKYAKKYGGADRTGAIFMTQGGGKVTALSSTAKDMCYSEGFQDAKASCLALHQTPPVAVGLQEPGAFAAYAASMLAWRHAAIQPLCDMLAESDTEVVAPIYGNGITIEIEARDVTDNDLQEKQLTNDLEAGAITLNEWRAIRGRPPIPGPEGDRLLKRSTSQVTPTTGEPAAAVSGNGTSLTPAAPLLTINQKSHSHRHVKGIAHKAALAAMLADETDPEEIEAILEAAGRN